MIKKKPLASTCKMPTEPDYSQVQIIQLQPTPSPKDYQVAMSLANQTAIEHINDSMLVSWYDRDRDYESPQNASECHQHSAIPGYIDYALYRHATLKVDIESGRFVFFYIALDEI